MDLNKYVKYIRAGLVMGAAVLFGFFISIEKGDFSRRHSILVDFSTKTASADIPGTGSGTSDSGTGSADSASGTGSSDSSDSGSGSGSSDSSDGDCGTS